MTTLASPMPTRAGPVMDADAGRRASGPRFSGDLLERSQRQRRIGLVVEPADLAAGVCFSHRTDERGDRAARRCRDRRDHRIDVQRRITQIEQVPDSHRTVRSCRGRFARTNFSIPRARNGRGARALADAGRVAYRPLDVGAGFADGVEVREPARKIRRNRRRKRASRAVRVLGLNPRSAEFDAL